MQHSLQDCHYDYILTKYNSQRKLKKTDLPSSVLFEWCAPIKIRLKAQKAQLFFGINKSVYGITQSNNTLDYELYYYYPNKNPKHTLSNIITFLNIEQPKSYNNLDYYLTSFKINLNDVPNIDLYNTDLSCCKHHSAFIDNDYEGYQICNICKATKKISLLAPEQENHYRFFSNIQEADVYIQHLSKKIWNIKYSINDVASDVLLNAKTKAMTCVSVKPDNTIGLYFSRINLENVLAFFEKNNFCSSLTTKIKNNMQHLSHLLVDVGYNICLNHNKSLSVKKLGFYGIF